MLHKTKYHLSAKDSELIYLDELMLRWPYLCYCKICEMLFKNKLKLYKVTERYVSHMGEQVNIIMLFPASNFTFEHSLKSFHAIAFKLSNIEKIEKKYLEFRYMPANPLVRHEFDMCTVKNIHRLAPQLAYSICLNGHSWHRKEFSYNSVIDDIYAKEFEPFLHIPKKYKKTELVLPNEELRGRVSFSYSKKPPKQTFDKSQVANFIKDKREQGVTNPVQLARLVDSFYPNMLTDAELGELLPAKPNKNIKFESMRKRGQRLRTIT